MTTLRWLVHGPLLTDPNELLFFDAWAWPALMVHIRPQGLQPGLVGHPVQDEWPKPVLDALGAAGRTVTPGVVMAAGAAESVLDAALGNPDRSDIVGLYARLGAELLVTPLPSPFTSMDVLQWFTRIDAGLWSITGILRSAGCLATAKLHGPTLSRVLAPGWQPTVAMCLPRFPRIDRAFQTRLPDLLAFLAADETRRHREALHGWTAWLGRADVPLASVSAGVAEAARAYAEHVERSGLAQPGAGVTELLWKLDDPAQAAELARPVGTHAPWWPLQRRGFAFGTLAEVRSDTPVAWVTDRPRGYP